MINAIFIHRIHIVRVIEIIHLGCRRVIIFFITVTRLTILVIMRIVFIIAILPHVEEAIVANPINF